MTELERELKEGLDGKFHKFVYTDAGTAVKVTEVSPNYIPDISFTNPFIEGARRGAMKRAAQQAKRSAAIWTEKRIADLTGYRALGYGSKRIAKLTGIGRGEIEGQIKRMGLVNKEGVPFQ